MVENENPQGGYAWDEDDDERSFADKLGVGLHFCHTKKVVFGSNQNGQFESAEGDPQVMLVFGDETHEGTLMLTCSEKAGWVIRKTCSALGNDMEAMKAANLHPKDFALEDVATGYLVGKFGWFNGFQRGQYVNFDPLKQPKVVKLKADLILKADSFDEKRQEQIANGADSKEAALEQAQEWAEEIEARVRAHYADGGEGGEPDAGESNAPEETGDAGDDEGNPFDS